MSGGAARQVMRQRCTILRDQGGTDAHGAHVKSNWVSVITGQPCFVYWTRGQQERNPGVIQAVEQLQLLLPIGVDVRATDRIGAVLDRLGNALFAGPFAIEGGVARRADHLLLTLKEID